LLRQTLPIGDNTAAFLLFQQFLDVRMWIGF